MRGSVFKRGRTWTAQVYLGRDAVTGRKRYRQLGGFGTKRAAEQALTEQLERLRVGEYVDAGATTVAGFVERWLIAVEPSLRPTTFASYRNMLGLHVVPRLGKVRLVKLTGLDLSGLYGELLASGYRKGNTTRGLSPTTVRYIHQIVRKALADAVRWGLLVRNPAAQVDPPRRSDQEMATWSAPQARRFIEAVADDRLRAMWVLLCSTGMRRGEVLGLRWDDVDLDAGRIAVQRALVEVSGYDLRLSDPKSARGKRSVRLDAHTTAELVRHRRRQLEERMAYGVGSRPEFVFTRPDGGQLQPQRISRSFQSLARRAELPSIRLHDLRHTAATLALAAGIHPKVVSERLGHSTIQLTLDTYSHVVEGIHEAAAEQLGDVLFGQTHLEG
ncbi:MAG: tyrosine-type recombinase/integrase [Tepidiformaceae bacterium]